MLACDIQLQEGSGLPRRFSRALLAGMKSSAYEDPARSYTERRWSQLAISSDLRCPRLPRGTAPFLQRPFRQAPPAAFGVPGGVPFYFNGILIILHRAS